MRITPTLKSLLIDSVPAVSPEDELSALDADDGDDADDAPDDDSLLALELDAEFPQPNSPRAITPATSKLSTFFFIII